MSLPLSASLLGAESKAPKVLNDRGSSETASVIKSIVIETRGFTFDALESGPADGEPVLLLHGFPDTSLMWTNLMKVLADKGYHCIAPDQRGYSPGARPTEIDAYRYEELIADAFAIGSKLGKRYHIIAHDWGANIAWLMLQEDPSPIASFTSIAVPHYQVWARAAHEDKDMAIYRTLLDIWMTPGKGEDFWTPDVMRNTFSAKPADQTKATIAHMKEPGAMTAALNWYRASDGQQRVLKEYEPWKVNVPTLLIFGSDDMGQSSVANSASLMTGPYRVVQPKGSHFIVDEQPKIVAAETLTHLHEHPVVSKLPKKDYTEVVGSVSFDMVYVPGGTFTLGCKSGQCPADTKPVSGVTVSGYHIAKNEVTAELYKAVMGAKSSGFGGPSMTWYDAMEFASKLSQMTGRNYRMPTEAEWEYAAKNHLSRLEDIGKNSMRGEEWVYNSWNTTHMGGTDPVGPSSGQHTQKTRRDIEGSTDCITGRLIRSIDGIGPALRLTVSHEMDFPPNYVPPCDIHRPVLGEEPVNSYRDSRWVTGSNERWTTGSIAIGSFDLRVWKDGTARLNNTNGQWFTSNNIAFVFVPSSGSSKKFAYIFLDETQGTLIPDQSFWNGGYTGRIVKESASSSKKPSISGLKSGAELAAAAGDDYKMVNMENIPESAKGQDPRLLDGPNKGWFQDNTSAGGLHHYRKDVDPEEFRFTVNQGRMIMLANGKWFTVNDTFLRITHPSGYTCDYLYTVAPNGMLFHNSYQAYERADFRMFQLKSNSGSFPSSCGEHCGEEIPMGENASIYSVLDSGHSTFVPAPCPPDR